MTIKHYLPSLGSAILLAAILMAAFVILWANNGKYEYEKTRSYHVSHKEIVYQNRYKNGWSQGRSVTAIIYSIANNSQYSLHYYTINPNKEQHKINVTIDGIRTLEKRITTGEKNSEIIMLSKGRHTINLKIDDTFNPKKLGINNSDKDLGVKFEVKVKAKNE
jgi:hypothetical protein